MKIEGYPSSNLPVSLPEVPSGPAPGMPRPSWEEYFLGLAVAASTRSDCTRRKVGAVIVKDRRIMATGYNGSPAGEPGCSTCPRATSSVASMSDYSTGPGKCVAVHAELNALLHCAPSDRVGAVLYITRPPCEDCLKHIRASGIVRVMHLLD